MNNDTYLLRLQCTNCTHIWHATFPNGTEARTLHKNCPKCGCGGLVGSLFSPIRNLGSPK